MIHQLYLCFQIHLLNFMRNKGAFFWALTFPLFFYTVFYSIFSGLHGSQYAIFLLTGVVGMTIVADGMFGVGSIIKQNYLNGTIRLLKKMPLSIVVYFSGLVLNRFLIILVLFLLLNLISFAIAGEYIAPNRLVNVFFGMFIGLWSFSFIGLSLSFFSPRGGTEKNIANFVYFIVLFTSNSFYPLEMFNEQIARFANYLPLNGLLDLMRGEPFDVMVMAFWFIVPVIGFYVLFNKVKYRR
jgi:ABC-2 type transport system permease protein